MKEEEFKNLLLQALEDDDVVRRLKEIFRDKGIPSGPEIRSEEPGDELRKELAGLRGRVQQQESALASKTEEIKGLRAQVERQNQELDDKTFTIQKSEKTINDLNDQIQRMEQSYDDALKEKEKKLQEKEEERKKATDELAGYQSCFQKPWALFESYKSLSEKARGQLSSIISVSSPLTFIASLSEFSHLESLWENIKYMILNGGRTEDTQKLTEIFVYFFNLMNDSIPEPVYKMIPERTGVRFDDTKHIRGFGSTAQGVVKEIQLPGYYAVNTRRIIRKSVVKAE